MQEEELSLALELGSEAYLALRNLQIILEVPVGQQGLVLDLDVMTNSELLDTNLWRIELINTDGQVYLPNTALLQYASYDALPLDIPTLASMSSSLAFVVP